MAGSTINSSNINYLVVAPTAFHEALKPLLEHRSKEYKTLLVDPEDIYKAFPGKSREEAVHQYVQDTYQLSSGGLKYLLIVSDDSTADLPGEIPIGQYSGTPDQAKPIYSDAYYGNINDDPWPEVATGRIPAQNESQVRAAVKKIISYENEKKPLAGNSRLAFYAGRGNFGLAQDLLLESFVYALIQRRIPESFSLDLHYDEPASIFNTGRGFSEIMNSGALMMSYIGHGSPNSLATKKHFTIANVNEIDIKGTIPILNLAACSAGCFANDNCLGEELALKESGPVAVIGSSQIATPIVLQLFNDRLATFLTSQDLTLGEAFIATQRDIDDPDDIITRITKLLPEDMLQKMDLTADVKGSIIRKGLELTMIGDPALKWMSKTSTTNKSTLSKDDARNKGPQLSKKMSGRIKIDVTAPKSPDEVTLNQLDLEDSGFVLTLLDYLLYRSEDLLGKKAKVLPRPGEITITNGTLRIPFNSEAVIGATELPPPLRKVFFPTNANGQLVISEELRFGITLKKGRVLLENIEGMNIIPARGGRRSVKGLDINFADKLRIRATFGAPDLTKKEIDDTNASLSEFFSGTSAAVQLEPTKEGTANYVLMRSFEGTGKTQKSMELSQYDSNFPPQFIPGEGVLLTLPYGKWISPNLSGDLNLFKLNLARISHS